MLAGRYRLVERIAVGGIGEVWRGVDVVLERRVAVNLLITGDGRVKITDFGIAHVAGSSPDTRTGMLVGTPAYLAPERVAGAQATSASDLYSLGIVAYECLVGGPPFTGTPVEVAVAHRERAVPPLPASVPPEVAALDTELTARDQEARPAPIGSPGAPCSSATASRARQLSRNASGRIRCRPQH